MDAFSGIPAFVRRMRRLRKRKDVCCVIGREDVGNPVQRSFAGTGKELGSYSEISSF
jgi:hypothetical protein